MGITPEMIEGVSDRVAALAGVDLVGVPVFTVLEVLLAERDGISAGPEFDGVEDHEIYQRGDAVYRHDDENPGHQAAQELVTHLAVHPVHLPGQRHLPVTPLQRHHGNDHGKYRCGDPFHTSSWFLLVAPVSSHGADS